MRLVICAVLLGVVAGYSHTPKSSYVSQQSIGNAKDSSVAEEPILLRIRNISALSTTAELPKSESTFYTSLPITTFSPSQVSTVPPAPKPLEAEIKPEKEETPAMATAMLALEEPLSESPGGTELLLPETEDTAKRRVITYDQRQEGQYNIRADLENFMIVLIPPSPADGLNLLDLLTKSSLRRTTTKNKRKHYSASSAGSHGNGGLKYRQNLKSGISSHNLNYLPRGHFSGHQPPLTLVENVSVQRLPSEFIEGRTPYHVDISANDDEQLRLQSDRQVDVLPPPYPLAYQHLIKPFHLDAEPTVIQTLPPADLGQTPHHASGNFLDTYNQLVASGLHANNALTSDGSLENSDSDESRANNAGFYRLSRAIRGDNFLDTNRLISSNSLGSAGVEQHRLQMPLYRAELSYGASNVYPPIDVPRLVGYFTPNKLSATIFESSGQAVPATDKNDDEQVQQLGDGHRDEVLIVPTSSAAEDELELDLHSGGVGFIDSEAKTLLGDLNGGMERCAPGRRRDSYGICREIEGY